MRAISGPQGPRVVADGRPVLLLSSGNALGLADHPRVREAAADAALRWGVGAGSARHVAGTMSVHVRLEDRLAHFHGTEAARLGRRALPAGARAVVDAATAWNPPDAVRYAHADPDDLARCLARLAGEDVVVVTDGVFALDGDVAPLRELAVVARRGGARLAVDESLAVGAFGPGGRGAADEAGVEPDLRFGSLGHALGTHGTYVAGDRAAIDSLPPDDEVAPAVPVASAALAALDILAEQPERVARLAANAAVLRDGLAREGFDVTGSVTHVISLVAGDAADALALAATALEQGVLVDATGTRVRLCAMAAHTRPELAEAARVLGRAALRCGLRPGTMVSVAEAQAGAEIVPLIRRAA